MEQDRNFRGIWIPKEIYLNKDLNWTEKILLIEISSLDNKNGCFASNAYFSEFIGITETNISKHISKLKRFGYIEQESFDGHTRILRSNLRVLYKKIIDNDNTPCLYRQDLLSSTTRPFDVCDKHNNIVNNTNNKNNTQESFLNSEYNIGTSKINTLEKLKLWDFINDVEFQKWCDKKPLEVWERLCYGFSNRNEYIQDVILRVEVWHGKNPKKNIYADYVQGLKVAFIGNDIKRISGTLKTTPKNKEVDTNKSNTINHLANAIAKIKFYDHDKLTPEEEKAKDKYNDFEELLEKDVEWEKYTKGNGMEGEQQRFIPRWKKYHDFTERLDEISKKTGKEISDELVDKKIKDVLKWAETHVVENYPEKLLVFIENDLTRDDVS